MRSILFFLFGLLLISFAVAEDSSTNSHDMIGKAIFNATKPQISEADIDPALDAVRAKGRGGGGGGGLLGGGASSLGSKSVSNPFIVLRGPLLLLNTILTTADASCTAGENISRVAKPRISEDTALGKNISRIAKPRLSQEQLNRLNEVRAKGRRGSAGKVILNAIGTRASEEELNEVNAKGGGGGGGGGGAAAAAAAAARARGGGAGASSSGSVPVPNPFAVLRGPMLLLNTVLTSASVPSVLGTETAPNMAKMVETEKNNKQKLSHKVRKDIHKMSEAQAAEARRSELIAPVE